MDASGQLWDRKQHRIDYFGDVCLATGGELEDVTVARAENLSEAGVFITTSQEVEVGAEVLCTLPLARERQLTLGGRVAWIRPASPRGMGIEFLDVNEDAAQALRVAIGPARQPAARVKVRFEGMPEPVRAEALPTDSGICLRTALPFLRLNSPVEVSFVDGEPSQQQGWLQEVTLQADWKTPVPRLQVKLAQQQLERPEVLEEPQSTKPLVAERELPSVLIDEEMIIADDTRSQDEAAYCCEALPPKEAQQDAIPLVQIKSRPTVRNSALTEQLLPACADESFGGEVDECEGSDWDLESVAKPSSFEGAGPIDVASYDDEDLPGMDPDEEDLHFWRRSSPPRRRVGLWFAALAMLAVAIASAHVTGFLGVAQQKLSPWLDDALALIRADQASDAAEATPRAPAVAKQVADSKPVVKRAPVATPAKQQLSATADLVAKTKLAGKATPAGALVPPIATKRSRRAPLELKVAGDVTRLRLPIQGSLRGKQSYPLANPDGLVVRLPHARSAIGHGTYKLRDGALRTLWIKRHERGVRFRVLYRRPRPACKLAITKTAVLVRCHEAKKLASR